MELNKLYMYRIYKYWIYKYCIYMYWIYMYSIHMSCVYWIHMYWVYMQRIHIHVLARCVSQRDSNKRHMIESVFWGFASKVPRLSTASTQIWTNLGTVVPSRPQSVDRWQPNTRSKQNITSSKLHYSGFDH